MSTQRARRDERRGNVVVLTAFMIVAMCAFLAFAIDYGYLLTARTELQRAADTAAMAACWELIDGAPLTGNGDMSAAVYDARTSAVNYAALNLVCTTGPIVDPNAGNDADGGVVVGAFYDWANPNSSIDPNADPSTYNAVQVRVNRTLNENGEVPFFFAQVLGITSAPAQAQATAALLKNIKGFKTPEDGGNLGMLPFALDEDTWNNMLAGLTPDSWTWSSEGGPNGSVTPGADGVLEVNLYPQGTGSPGNRGTVDIGSSNNSTADVARQIVDGVNKTDLDYMGGELTLNEFGELFLNGDTGISAGVKDELTSVIGRPSIIPIFNSVAGNGNNADYTIIKFAGVRIMEVKLTGKLSGKRVIIQPASMVTKGTVQGDENQTSDFVYSPVILVR